MKFKDPKNTVPAKELDEYETAYNGVLRRQGKKIPTLPPGASDANYKPGMPLASSKPATLPVPTSSTKPGTPASSTKGKLPETKAAGGKAPAAVPPKPAIVPKNQIEKKVAEKIVAQPLPIDKDKKDFAAAQARQTAELQADIAKGAAKIQEYEKQLADFPNRHKATMEELKKTKASVAVLEEQLLNLLEDEDEVQTLLDQK